jgi:Zn-dependent protease
MYKKIRIGKFQTSNIEINSLLKAWLAISVAFAIVISNRFTNNFFLMLITAALTVGLGFIFHELAHKLTAQKYGCFAEFRSFNTMLILAIAMSFFGFIFAAPGAVMIQGDVNQKKNGKISISGAAANLGLAIIFLILGILFPSLTFITNYGVMINAFLALFNMIPVWNLDEQKELKCNKPAYFAVVIIALLLLFL